MIPARHRAIGLLQIFTGLAIALFWVLFLWFDVRPANPPPCYLSFEQSFVVPDAILAGALLFGGTLLWQGKRGGVPVSLPCGGALTFLGVLDVSFNLQNRMYSQSLPQALENLAINLWCVGFGLAIILVLSRGGRWDGRDFA